MKTVFICKSLNLRVEGLDNRPYAVNERITLKHHGRWLPMIVDAVQEDGDIRQVVLKLNKASDSAQLRRSLRATAAAQASSQDWVKQMLDTIDGGRGPVRW